MTYPSLENPIVPEAGEMTQSIKVPCDFEDLCSEAQRPDRKPSWWHAFVFPVLRKQRWENYWGSQVS